MRKALTLFALAAMIGLAPSKAEACGGMFCNTSPVDQTAERIIFEVTPEGTTMTVQINYTGTDPGGFSWVLPTPVTPDVESLQAVPTEVLDFFRNNTNPQFIPPDDCFGGRNFGSAPSAAGSDSAESDDGGRVDVAYAGVEVGPYEIASVSSDDPMALVEWLNENNYTVTPPMEPYIVEYAEAGNKFLAVKLQGDAEVNAIQPLRFSLPGEGAMIPLVISRIAIDPGMSIMAFILGDQRYQSANWANVEIDGSEIQWSPGGNNNYFNVVANTVAAADDSVGWVTERAGSIDDMRLRENAMFFSTVRIWDYDEEGNPLDENGEIILLGEDGRPAVDEGRDILTDILGDHEYMTRLYTRIHPGSVNSDPVFRRSDRGDFDGNFQLSRIVDGVDVCEDVANPSPCAFTSCGPGGECRTTRLEDGSVVGACACTEGATARTTFDPQNNVTTTCQDMRGSFINPGDENGEGETLGDPCAGFSCGELGECVAMNMTPTCRCAVGAVAYGWLDADGLRRNSCFAPMRGVPDSFYDEVRLPDFRLPGRIDLIQPMDRDPVITPPMTELDMRDEASCSVSSGSTAPSGALFAVFGLAGLALLRRRR